MNENDRSIVGFTMVGHAMVHTYELSIPILMTIWLLEFSTTTAALGIAVAIGYGLFGIGALPGGILVDKYGSRALIVVCLAGMGVSFLLLSVADGIVSTSLALAIWGIAASVYHPAGLTLISNGVSEHGRAFGYHGMAGNVGIALGPLATALLLLAFDWRFVAVVLAIPALIAAVVGVFISFDETAAVDTGGGREFTSGNRSIADVVGDTRRLFTIAFLTVFAVVALNGLYYRGMLTFLPDLLGGFLETAIGDVELGIIDPESPIAEEFDLAQYLYAGLLMVGIGGQYVGGRLVDSIDPDRGLVIMLSVLTVIALVFAPIASTGLWQLVLVSVALGFSLFAMQPLTQATVAKYSPPEARGISFGYTYLAIFGIGALGAAIAGTVLTHAPSVSYMFVVLAIFAATGGLLAASLGKRKSPTPRAELAD